MAVLIPQNLKKAGGRHGDTLPKPLNAQRVANFRNQLRHAAIEHAKLTSKRSRVPVLNFVSMIFGITP